MPNLENSLKQIHVSQFLKRASMLLLGLIWLTGILITATRPIVRLIDFHASQQPIDNLTTLFSQFNTYNPDEYETIATQFRHATQQINTNQLILWVTSDVSDDQYVQLHMNAQLWVYPKTLHNNPVFGDTRLDQLPDLAEGCQMIQEEIMLCPYSG